LASRPPRRVDRNDLQRMVSDKLARPSRRQIIASGGAAGRIDVADNPSADGSRPWFEAPGFQNVTENEKYIAASAKKYTVDPDLVRAVAWMETTHGYYEAPLRWIDQSASVLPMNINTDFWKDTWGSREALKDPEKNIDAGARMLKSLPRCPMHRLPQRRASTTNLMPKKSAITERVSKKYMKKSLG